MFNTLHKIAMALNHAIKGETRDKINDKIEPGINYVKKKAVSFVDEDYIKELQCPYCSHKFDYYKGEEKVCPNCDKEFTL